MKSVLCVGHASWDVTIPFDGFPIENNKYRVKERVECGGGPASNAAYLLGKWGVKTYFAGLVGNDPYGNKIKAEFDSVNVDTSYLELNPKVETTNSFILVNKNTGSRTVMAYRSTTANMKDIDVNFWPDVLLFDGQELDLSLKLIKKFKSAISILDAGSFKPATVELAKNVNYAVCSHDFAEGLTNLKIDLKYPKGIAMVFSKMKEEIKGEVIITIEDKGALYCDKGVIKRIPSIKRIAKDTTGAGDIFHGAFAYAILNGYSIEKAIKLGNVTGALSVTKVGGRNSVPEFKEVEEIYGKSL